MTTEMTVISLRNELVAGLIACTQGLDIRRVDLAASPDNLQALLEESVITDLTVKLFDTEAHTAPWISVSWCDDVDVRWSVICDVSHATLDGITFDDKRWSSHKIQHIKLTNDEFRMILNKECAHNGT